MLLKAGIVAVVRKTTVQICFVNFVGRRVMFTVIFGNQSFIAQSLADVDTWLFHLSYRMKSGNTVIVRSENSIDFYKWVDNSFRMVI